MVDGYAALFNCTLVDRASDSIMAPDLKLFILVGLDRNFRLLLGPPGSTDYLLLLQIFSGVV